MQILWIDPSGFLACIPYQCNVYSVAMLGLPLSDPIIPGMCIAKTLRSKTKLDHDYHCKELDREVDFFWGGQKILWTEEPGELQSMGLQKSQIQLSDEMKTNMIWQHVSLNPRIILINIHCWKHMGLRLSEYQFLISHLTLFLELQWLNRMPGKIINILHFSFLLSFPSSVSMVEFS